MIKESRSLRCGNNSCARCGNKDGEKISGTRISEGRKKIPAETSYREWRAGIGEVGYNPKIRTKPLTAAEIKTIKDAEDAAYKAVTGADFGFKKRTAEAKWSEEIIYANGDGKGIGRKTNCQRCVVAHEARMRGYDVIARLSWGSEDPMPKVVNWLNIFEETGRAIYKCEGEKLEEIEKDIAAQMTEWGKGSRAFVWFQWENPFHQDRDGHVIVTHLNENGFVQYGDPQTGKIGAIRCLSGAKLGSVKLMRVDNLKFTDEVKRCCVNKE